MIKTIFRARHRSRYNSSEWFFLFLLSMVFMCAFNGFTVYWGLYFFSPFYDGQLTFFTCVAVFGTPIYFISRWLNFVSQHHRGVFDKEKPKKEKPLDRGTEALNFIRGVRRG